MSWLDDVKYDYFYSCKECGIEFAEDERKEAAPCPECGKNSEYRRFHARNFNVTTVTEGEQNGRIFYETRTTDGKIHRISKTKREYLKTGQNKSYISKDYAQHVQNEQMREFGKFKKRLESSANVTPAGKGALNES